MLALENRKEPEALRYLFRILDVQQRGYLNVFSLNYFFRVSITDILFLTQALNSKTAQLAYTIITLGIGTDRPEQTV